MTAHDTLIDDIRENNLSYLLIAQQLLRSDFESACVQLGIQDEAAQVLRDLSLAQVRSLAGTPLLITGFRMTNADVLRSLAQTNVNSITQRARFAMALAQSAAVTPTAL